MFSSENLALQFGGMGGYAAAEYPNLAPTVLTNSPLKQGDDLWIQTLTLTLIARESI